jgi:CRISPR/Cas system CSM-associated protein Csm3 (group 7 of RAMP superfamily)
MMNHIPANAITTKPDRPEIVAWPILHVLRLTIEAVTPISSSSGESLGLYDNALARDANGLPTLMGTTLAGILRHLHADYFHGGNHDLNDPSHPTNRLFGLEESGQSGGQASAIEVSFGFVHDVCDRPVARRVMRAQIQQDEVLEFLWQPAPVRRDGVAIDGRGVASEHQKFERVSVPAGTRFTLELALESEGDTADDGKKVLLEIASLFQCPYLRIGGATRRGLGRVRIAEGSKVLHVRFDRSTAAGWNAYARWRATEFDVIDPAFGEVEHLGLPQQECARKPVTGTITLTFEGWWRFGQGERSILAALPRRSATGDRDDKEPDQRPVTEAVITYPNGKGKLVGDGRRGDFQVVAAAAGVKGAVAHRAEYELNRLRGQWADSPPRSRDEFRQLLLHKRGMDPLLGSINDQTGGQAGCILVDDAWLEEIKVDSPRAENVGRRVGSLTHNSLDRFTQGVRSKILFTEESMWQGTLEFKVCALTRRWSDPEGSKPGRWIPHELEVRIALARALDALVKGNLAVGADSGDGHGYCRPDASTVSWEDSGAWLSEPEATAEEQAGAVR